MKIAIINIAQAIISFVKAHTVISIVTAAAVVITAIATPVAVNVIREKQESAPEVSQNEASGNEPPKPEENKTEDPAEETSDVVVPVTDEKDEEKTTKNEEKKEDKKDVSSSNKNKASNKKPSSNKNESSNKNNTSNKNESSSSDNKAPANTNPAPQTEKTVVNVLEGVNGSGCRYIITAYSDGSSKEVVECQYCHGFPCPNGGGESCPQYDIKKDGAKTCQQCGQPYGDGYNGTCNLEIDWANGGKLICNHYD